MLVVQISQWQSWNLIVRHEPSTNKKGSESPRSLARPESRGLLGSQPSSWRSVKEKHARRSRNEVTYQPGHLEGVPCFLSASLHLSARGQMTSAATANNVMWHQASRQATSLKTGGGDVSNFQNNVQERFSSVSVHKNCQLIFFLLPIFIQLRRDCEAHGADAFPWRGSICLAV